MATGMVENWANVDVTGPIYPFVGSEVLLVGVGLVFWIGWHIIQLKEESSELESDVDKISQSGGIGDYLDKHS